VKNSAPEILAVLLLLVAVFLLIHQQLTSGGVWFNWQQFLHHESFIACSFVAAIALLAGKYLGRH